MIAADGREQGIATRHQKRALARPAPDVPSDVPAMPAMDSWANLRSLGAVGDGKTDDTDALLAAIDKHAVLYFPTGTYRVSRPLLLKPDTVLIGLNPGTTQISLIDGSAPYAGKGEPVGIVIAPKGGKNIVRALEAPIFKIWGHPLGRLVGRRPPVACDLDVVLAAAARSRCAIEINGDPHRLDLAPELVRQARALGARFVLSTDAHAIGNLDYVETAVDMARRGRLGRRGRAADRELDPDAGPGRAMDGDPANVHAWVRASKKVGFTLDGARFPGGRRPANIGRDRAGGQRVRPRLASGHHCLSDCYRAACEAYHAGRVARAVCRKVTKASLASRMVIAGNSLADRVIHNLAGVGEEGCELSPSRQYLYGWGNDASAGRP